MQCVQIVDLRPLAFCSVLIIKSLRMKVVQMSTDGLRDEQLNVKGNFRRTINDNESLLKAFVRKAEYVCVCVCVCVCVHTCMCLRDRLRNRD